MANALIQGPERPQALDHDISWGMVVRKAPESRVSLGWMDGATPICSISPVVPVGSCCWDGWDGDVLIQIDGWMH